MCIYWLQSFSTILQTRAAEHTARQQLPSHARMPTETGAACALRVGEGGEDAGKDSAPHGARAHPREAGQKLRAGLRVAEPQGAPPRSAASCAEAA